jgi:predicted kinase
MLTAIVDLDGTLFDCRHRLHHVLPGGKRDWQAFFAAMKDDTLIEPVARVVDALASRYKVVLASGRPEEWRPLTEFMLDEGAVPYDSLYMRATDDTRPDHIVKAEILRAIKDDGFQPFIVIDDRQSVVDMWRENGLVCLQAAPGSSPVPPGTRLTVMVGPSGAGKTSWLEMFGHTFGIQRAHVISSDQFRSDLASDFRDQTKNAEVFAAIHAVAATRLKHGLPTVIDATHIRRKDRITAASLVPDTCEVRYVVINRPLADKYRDGAWRNHVVNDAGERVDLIGNHDNTFKQNERDILNGDGLPNVTVIDLRGSYEAPAMKEAA